MSDYIDILFDRHPATPTGECCFIEVEDDTGQSIRAGEWVERENGMVALRITDRNTYMRSHNKDQSACDKYREALERISAYPRTICTIADMRHIARKALEATNE